ncbi:MAG: tRNA (adenosine(37)-N6)-dimethylallyltransferase MiaA [Lachnospiraceae bacterium]|nr:tRNA (adenosine(37)-N6)-dimethylallyltransferase MiaA [Lachnospiraceae bacterium]
MENGKKPPLVILTGPTAVGKTDLSIALAKKLDAEIISADSMQVYRHMDIGSAKIKAEQMQGIRHHLTDILDPRESFDVTVFKEKAMAAAEDIISRGKMPLVVGGTGFYIQALLYDIDFNDEASDPVLRKKLEEQAVAQGAKAMHDRLALVDEKSAQAIPAGNLKRVIRALEFYELTGTRISDHNEEQRKKEPAFNASYFVLTDERAKLYARIDKRVDIMMAEGLEEEVRRLIEMGVKEGDTSMQGLGYREMYRYLTGCAANVGQTAADEGEEPLTLERTVSDIKRNTRHFAKRQLTWFKRERDVIWIEKSAFAYDDDAMLSYMLEYIEKKGDGCYRP